MSLAEIDPPQLGLLRCRHEHPIDPQQAPPERINPAIMLRLLLVLLIFIIALCLSSLSRADTFTGQASFYQLTSKTANGERVGSHSCAHRSLPFGTALLVTNLSNQKMAIVIVNDRGPFTGHRLIDVSKSIAKDLDFIRAGVTQVQIDEIGFADTPTPQAKATARSGPDGNQWPQNRHQHIARERIGKPLQLASALHENH